jgi:hypothetical protein
MHCASYPLSPYRVVAIATDKYLTPKTPFQDPQNSAALSAHNSVFKSPAQKRIHQALQQAGWDITKVIAPTDLGVPALNNGSLYFSTEDFDNGLGLMINGVQHAYAVATHYHHDAAARRYCIGLKFVFYDVFGLDDDDLREYGVTPGTPFHIDSAIGITAWWQLQHQFGYAPLVTRVVVRRAFEAEAI